MNENRREFLRRFGLLLLGVGVGVPLQAAGTAPRWKEPVRFTRNVRAVTAGLRIQPRRWSMIIGHHSGLPRGNAAIYGREHLRRKMENGLAYHFVIGNGLDSGDGEIEIGPRWTRQLQGGHVRFDRINEVAIGICLVGNFELTKPTKNQIAAFDELMRYLRGEIVGRGVKFAVHREVDPGRTVCPGKNFPIRRMHRLYG